MSKPSSRATSVAGWSARTGILPIALLAWSVATPLMAASSAVAASVEIPLDDGTSAPQQTFAGEQQNSSPGSSSIIWNVLRPSLVVYLPQRKATHRAVIICPGGGLRFLSWEAEGVSLARWFTERGDTAFVLKYRLVPMPARQQDFIRARDDFVADLMNRTRREPLPLGFAQIFPDAESELYRSLATHDLSEAVRLVRSRHVSFGVDPAQVGVVGVSAGGFLATALAFGQDPRTRPDFLMLFYGGDGPEGAFSGSPIPTFAVVAQDDRLMARTLLRLVVGWQKAGWPIDFHLYSRGGHAFLPFTGTRPVDGWRSQASAWLADLPRRLKP